MTGRASFKVLRLLAAFGLGLSFVGLVTLLVISVADLATRPMPPDAARHVEILMLGVLEPFRDAGIPLLLAALLYSVCEVGLHLTRPTDHDPEA